jgi:hypothetical protein
MRLQTLALAAFATLFVMSHAARADVETIKRAGAWEAFGGTSNSGRPVCGVSSTGAGKYFGLKYFSGERTLTIQLGSKDWRIKNGATQNVMMQIDTESPWQAVATGMHFSDGDAGLEFNIRRKEVDKFMAEFRDGNQLFVRFPGSSVTDWRANLDGSDVISDTFLGCLKAMGNTEENQ